MNAPSRPRLKSITAAPTGLSAAQQAVDTTAVGVPEGAARKGVRTALRSDPQGRDGRYVIAALHITAPRGATPTATSKCLCGWDRSAVGHKRVLALIADHTTHRDTCPLRNPQERRTAA
ncbi:hypothetical protein ACFYNL_16510 [Streptomyces sp. NPDC007808]|uniref:hypothetical protein n=1 Tax=Streptomyces sp. NPDC007808 TaxID=3364779 RepID=UPI003698B3DC